MTLPTETESILTPALDEADAFRRADRLSRLAADVGFDWPTADAALEKLAEEIEELRHEVASGAQLDIEAELGDVLFSVLNVARKCDVDPERAIQRTNGKFVQRFEAIEQSVRDSGRSWSDHTLDELESIWLSAKK